jgi:phospholipase/carboxylesterase
MSRNTRIQARPFHVARSEPTGYLPLELGKMRDSYIYVPGSYRFEVPSALILMLHGSGGHAHHGVELLEGLAERAGIILVAPASKFYAWSDGPTGPLSDAKTINRSLEYLFQRYAVDPARISVAGFSDGASYAINLGLTNPELFKHVIAFSPRFVVDTDLLESRNKPRVFISHGMRDEVMPISTCAQRIVSPLERAGVDVEYAEFEAGHRIPPNVAAQAFDWLTKASESSREPRRAQSLEMLATQEG